MAAPVPWREVGGGPAPDALARLRAADGVGLRAAFWRGDGPLVLLLPGRTEHLEKYGPFARALAGRGASVAALDWRGQGLSDRVPATVGRLGHVGDFAAYGRDLAALLAWAPVAGAEGPRLLIAHSMGGCIALRALLEGAVTPRAALFSAPMWGLALPGPLARLAPRLAAASWALGLGFSAAPGEGAGRPYVLRARFADNVLVRDRAVWDRFGAELAAAPELATHAPTLGWLDAAFREMRALAAAPGPALPHEVLLGSEERVVSAAAIRARVAAAGGAARLTELPGARHEPLMEPPGSAIGAAVADALDRLLAAGRD